MVFALIALIVWILDRATKIWVVQTLPLWSSRPLLGKWLYITHVRNTGAAFGLFGGQAVPLAFVSLGLFLILFLLRSQLPALGTSGKLALAMIIGGAVGNLYDRLKFGYVIDFLDLKFWPVFNVADSAVVVGAILLVFVFWAPEREITGNARN